MAKYKVGDKVRVKTDLVVEKSYYMEDHIYHDTFVEEMKHCKGQIVTIEHVYANGGGYSIKEHGFSWTDEMFEPVIKSTTEIREIKLEGNMKFEIKDYKVVEAKKEVVVFFTDGDVQKAKACDGDIYDFERGLEVCLMKHICGGADKYHKALKVADNQITEINKAKEEAEKRAKIKARQRAKRAEKRRLRAEAKRAARIAEMKEAYLSALKEYNGDTDKIVEAVESGK